MAASRAACPPGSHADGFTDGAWPYLDSYFGGTEFVGRRAFADDALTLALQGQPAPADAVWLEGGPEKGR